MTIILFLVVLAVLVFVHELGHFLFAKWTGMRVDEFAIGFPPRLVSFRKGETLYTLNLIPFGGFVKIYGENPDETVSEADKSRSFGGKNRFKQAVVLLAGVAFNWIFAVIALAGVLMAGTFVSADMALRQGVTPSLVVAGVVPDSPAARGGVLAGDIVRTIRGADATIDNPRLGALQEFAHAHDGIPVTLVLDRQGAATTTTVLPARVASGDRAVIGVSLYEEAYVQLPWYTAIFEGARLAVIQTKAIAVGMADLLVKLVHGNANTADVTGPIGIARLVGEASESGVAALLSFVAFISLNLAVLNLIPFPALDGGRLLFVFIEGIIRRPLPRLLVNGMNLVGFGLLMILMVVVTARDIMHLWG